MTLKELTCIRVAINTYVYVYAFMHACFVKARDTYLHSKRTSLELRKHLTENMNGLGSLHFLIILFILSKYIVY
jgi:hypothetical protein